MPAAAKIATVDVIPPHAKERSVKGKQFPDNTGGAVPAPPCYPLAQ